MTDIKLTGLKAHDSLGYRAALGVLQVCEEMPETSGSQLSFQEGTAVLTTPDLDRDVLLDLLERFYERRHEDPRWYVAEGHGVSFEHYREMAREFETAPHRLAWLRGTVTDQESYKDPRRCAHTRWDTMRGGQRTSIFSVARGLVKKAADRQDRRSVLESTLFGPWSRDDDTNPIGWDIQQAISAAQTGTSIKNIEKRTDLFAMMFAVESLCLFPVNAKNGRRETAGFRNGVTTWGTWRNPVGIDTVRALIDYPTLHELQEETQQKQRQQQIHELRVLGFTEAFRAELRFRNKVGYVTRPHRVV